MSTRPPEIQDISVRFATFRDQAALDRGRFAAELARVEGEERVLLDTCHRVELVTVRGGASSTSRASTANGLDAVERVFDVAAGFDSAVVAEEQLLGQVRTAYEAALATGSTGPVLNELFRRALRFGRRVRTHARPGSDRSLADRGIAWLAPRLTDFSAITVVGTGEMARLVANRLAAARHPVRVVSGSAERADRLRASLPGSGHRALPGTPTAAAFDGVEAIVLAVRTRAPVLTSDLLGAGATPRVLDMSSPSAVEPGLADRLGDHLLTIDALGRMKAAAPVFSEAVERRLRHELRAEVEGFAEWLSSRQGAEAVAVLHGAADAVRGRHLDRLRKRARLDAGQLEEVDAAAAAMLADFLHGPTLAMRRDGTDAQLVRRLFGVDA